MGRRLDRRNGSVRVACPRCRGVVRVEIRIKEGRGAPAKPRTIACPRRECGGIVRIEISVGRGRAV
jgi:hypothetical protein